MCRGEKFGRAQREVVGGGGWGVVAASGAQCLGDVFYVSRDLRTGTRGVRARGFCIEGVRGVVVAGVRHEFGWWRRRWDGVVVD